MIILAIFLCWYLRNLFAWSILQFDSLVYSPILFRPFYSHLISLLTLVLPYSSHLATRELEVYVKNAKLNILPPCLKSCSNFSESITANFISYLLRFFWNIFKSIELGLGLSWATPYCTPSAAPLLVSKVMYVKIKPLETPKKKKMVQNSRTCFTNIDSEFLVGFGICICIWARTWRSSYLWQSLRITSLKAVN